MADRLIRAHWLFFWKILPKINGICLNTLITLPLHPLSLIHLSVFSRKIEYVLDIKDYIWKDVFVHLAGLSLKKSLKNPLQFEGSFFVNSWGRLYRESLFSLFIQLQNICENKYQLTIQWLKLWFGVHNRMWQNLSFALTKYTKLLNHTFVNFMWHSSRVCIDFSNYEKRNLRKSGFIRNCTAVSAIQQWSHAWDIFCDEL